MRIPRIYQNIPLQPSMTLSLDEHATRHLKTVLRFKTGDRFILFNGDGNDYPSVITHVKHHSLEVEVIDSVNTEKESLLLIHLGQAISKGERMDLTLQKATELGVAHITPLFSERCEVQLKGERLEKKIHHWQKIIISSCEQCGRNRIPALNAPVHLEEWVRNSKEDTKLFLDHHSDIGLTELKSKISHSLCLLTGPEGGFDDRERQYAKENGFIGIKMGPRVLRTETAGMVAIALLQFLAGDLG